jgi:hypothetical protein
MASKRYGAACGSVRLGCWQIAGNSGPGDQRQTRGRPAGKAVLAGELVLRLAQGDAALAFCILACLRRYFSDGRGGSSGAANPCLPVSGCSGGSVGCLPAVLLPVGYSLPRGLAASGGAWRSAAPSCSSRPRWAHLAWPWRSASNASCRSRWAISLRCHHRVSRTWPGGTSRRAIISSWGCQGSRSTRAHQRLW